MANVKITGLPAASTPLAGTELFEVVQSGSSAKVAAKDIANTYSATLPVANGGTGATTLTGYVKGAGTSALTASATIPYADLAGRAYISAISTSDQTGNVSAATAVTFGSTLISAGISIVASSQITFTAAGTYMLAPSLQFTNTDTIDHDVTIWFRKNGTNIVNSATVISVPKAADGGNMFFQIIFYEQVAVSGYIEVMWLPANIAVTLDFIAAGAIAPAAPSVILSAERIA